LASEAVGVDGFDGGGYSELDSRLDVGNRGYWSDRTGRRHTIWKADKHSMIPSGGVTEVRGISHQSVIDFSLATSGFLETLTVKHDR
jgi:hypothetical protein